MRRWYILNMAAMLDFRSAPGELKRNPNGPCTIPTLLYLPTHWSMPTSLYPSGQIHIKDPTKFLQA